MSKLTDKDLIYNVYFGFCRIRYYIDGMSDKDFDNDIKTRDAVKYNLMKIGMWSSKLTKDFTAKYSDFPWLLAMLNIEGFFAEEELLELLRNKGNGILRYFEAIEKLFVAENPVEAKELQISPNGTRDNVPLSTTYKYPIHTKSSIWAVRKK